jgi:hypothetical protein
MAPVMWSIPDGQVQSATEAFWDPMKDVYLEQIVMLL